MKTRRWLITLAACLLVFAGLAGFKWMQISAAIAVAESYPEPSETVEAVRSEAFSMQPSVTTLGEIVAPQTVALRNEIEGRVVAVNFESGAVIERGQVLLQLDIGEETARLEAARASAELARLDLRRIAKLRENRTVSEERYDQAKAQYDIAAADIRALQAVISKKTLRAPFDAYAGLHQLEAGELLESNTLITTLVGINDYVWVDFHLPLHQAGATAGTEVEVTPVGGRGEALTAQIVARDSMVSAESRNLRFRARLRTQDGIRPNAVVNVRVPVGAARTRVSVPATAIKRDGLGEHVFVLEEDDSSGAYRARRRPVTLGSQDEQRVTILSSLEPGELVAANGAFKLRDGLLVYVKERRAVVSAQE